MLKEVITKSCSHCGNEFTYDYYPSMNQRNYCSRACGNRSPLRAGSRWFWQRVNTDGECWTWTAATGRGGYGVLRANNKQQRAHRYSYELHYGPVPNGLWVLHRCDNPPCVRPDHLFLGTVRDNVADMDAKGRRVAPAGTANTMAKLTESDILTIRKLVAEGIPQKELSAIYGVSRGTISLAVNRLTWSHVA